MSTMKTILTSFILALFSVDQIQTVSPHNKVPSAVPWWITSFTPKAGSSSVTLEVAACKSVSLHVRTAQPESLFTLVLGTGHNRVGALFNSSMSLLKYWEYHPSFGPVLNCAGWMPFWLSWGNGQLAVGRGNTVNKQVLLSYKLVRPLHVTMLRSVAGSTRWKFNTACSCQNGGHCVYYGKRSICRCLKRFTGANCEQKCQCKHGFCFMHCCRKGLHKECRSACHCYAGKTGKHCDKVCPCKHGNCNPMYSCPRPKSNKAVSSATCRCDMYHKGKYCNVRKKTVKKCKCQHGYCIVRCKTLAVGRRCYHAGCRCYSGYTGRYCAVHAVTVVKCVHGNRMSKTSKITGRLVSYCHCNNNFVGIHCDIKLFTQKCRCPQMTRCVYAYKCQYKRKICMRYVKFCKCADFNPLSHKGKAQTNPPCKCGHGVCEKAIRGKMQCSKPNPKSKQPAVCCRRPPATRCRCNPGYGGVQCQIQLINANQITAVKEHKIPGAPIVQKPGSHAHKKAQTQIKAPPVANKKYNTNK